MTQTIQQQLALCDLSQAFFAAIPTDLRENIEETETETELEIEK